MLINIAGQKHCYCCPFNDYEQGYCYLSEATGMNETDASWYANTGWEKYIKHHCTPTEEIRPEWCPFKTAEIRQNKKMMDEIIKNKIEELVQQAKDGVISYGTCWNEIQNIISNYVIQ